MRQQEKGKRDDDIYDAYDLRQPASIIGYECAATSPTADIL
jgi:hypothetical protein